MTGSRRDFLLGFAAVATGTAAAIPVPARAVQAEPGNMPVEGGPELCIAMGPYSPPAMSPCVGRDGINQCRGVARANRWANDGAINWGVEWSASWFA